ncbi:MAG: hypothetical protein ABIG69_11800 [Bacteroidota bacterium]
MDCEECGKQIKYSRNCGNMKIYSCDCGEWIKITKKEKIKTDEEDIKNFNTFKKENVAIQ